MSLKVYFFLCALLLAALLSAARASAVGGSECARGVSAFLRERVARRGALVESLSAARAALNDARAQSESAEKDNHNNKEKEKEKEKVNAALSEFERAAEKVRAFDAAAARRFGELPEICVKEVASAAPPRYFPDPTNTNTVTTYLYHYGESALLHVRLFALTARGVADFVIDSYAPMAEKFFAFAETFRAQSRAVFAEQSGRFADAELFSDKCKIAMRYAEAAVLATVPYALFTAAALFAFIFWPFCAGAFVLPHLLWRVWAELFLLQRIFGLRAETIAETFAETFAQFVAQPNWTALRDGAARAIATLAAGKKQSEKESGKESEADFFNGIIAGGIVLLVAVGMIGAMIFWARALRRLLGGAGNKRKESGEEGGGKKKTRRENRKGQNPSSQSPPAGAERANDKKKKNA